jgi:hypothetical protein
MDVMLDDERLAEVVRAVEETEREQGLMQALVDIAHGIEAVLAGRGEPELTMRERVAIAAMLTTAWQRAGAAEALRCAFTFLEASRGLGAPCSPPRTDD